MTAPDRFLRDRRGAEGAVLAAAAALTGIFDLLAGEALPPEEVARRLALDARAVRIVLPALAGEGYLEREGEGFRTAPGLPSSLAPGSPRGGLAHWLHLLGHWTRLPDVLRGGGPVGEGEETAGDRIVRFMGAMAAQPGERAARVARLVRERSPEGRKALDLGGGPGVYARALLREGFEVVLLDLPEVVAHVSVAYGLGELPGLRLVAGDFLRDPLPEGPFDVALLSNITHMLDPAGNRELLRRVRRRLRPGGVVAIADMVRGRSPLAPRFAVVMLLRTEGGDTYAEEEYRAWLEEAGFGRIRVADLDGEGERQLISGEAV